MEEIDETEKIAYSSFGADMTEPEANFISAKTVSEEKAATEKMKEKIMSQFQAKFGEKLKMKSGGKKKSKVNDDKVSYF